MRYGAHQIWSRFVASGPSLANPARPAGAAVPGHPHVAAFHSVARRLPDTVRRYLPDVLIAACGLVGALAAAQPLFSAEAAGDAQGLHGVFLACVTVMLLGTVRFLVRTMDLPELIGVEEEERRDSHGRARLDESSPANE